MSKLIQAGRPWVSFNASNPQHRQWFAEFQRKGTWGRCPVRFLIAAEEVGDLVTIIQRSLIKHYVDQEFGEIIA
jgi:hypothetical protein